MGKKPLPNIQTPDDLDEKDAEIIAALEVNPDATVRDISNRTGIPTTTVWDRIRRIRKSDWVEQMRQDLKGLGGIILRTQEEGMEYGEYKDRAAVGQRLLRGLGVLTDKRGVEISWADATPEQIKTAIAKLSDEDLAKLIADREAAEGS